MKKKQKLPKLKKGAWFIPLRGSYLPYSWQGWLTYIPFTAFLVYSLVVGFAYTDSNLLAIMYIFPNWVAAAVLMTWIAKQKS